MAWGYWNATSAADRGRSPRRNKETSQENHSNISSSSKQQRQIISQVQNIVETVEEPALQQTTSAVQAETYSTIIPSSINNAAIIHHQSGASEIIDAEFIEHEHQQLSRRPSLDLDLMIGSHHPSALTGIVVCPAHHANNKHNNKTGTGTGGTLSAGNTLTRQGSRHTAVEYAVPHAFDHHYHHAFVEYHQDHMSLSDDDSSSEPGYDCIRTGDGSVIAYSMAPTSGNFNFGSSVVYSSPSTQAESLPGQGEDRSIYRRGARRWRKLYRINGHIFQAKRFNRKAFCAYCHDRIWGLGRQGFKCIQCKLLVHKKCHKAVNVACTNEHNIDNILSGDDRGGVDQQTLHIIVDTPPPRPNFQASFRDLSSNNKTPLLDPTISELNNATEDSNNTILLDELDYTDKIRQYSLNDFNLIRVIGRGSYAKVLMVELKKTKKIYAMKVIKKALVTDDEDIDWVQTEKHVFETASNHPFLVGLHSCFQTLSRLFFVVEFVKGGDLMYHMQRQRKLPEEHAKFYAAEISLALSFLHSKGIIYRDLKLDNVLLDHEGHIKLTDYGMCKEGIRLGDTTSTFCGTPNYIAPEILRGEDYGFSVDWWALGVLLYEMLAGRSPFDIAGASENPDQNTEDFLFQVILEKTIRIPRSLSVKAANVLKGFLNKNPIERLGCGGTTTSDSFCDITGHSFFRSVDWDLLEQKRILPPYKPRLDSDRDLTNFPPEFTDEPVHLTPDDPSIIKQIDQSEFEGFEYVNPLLMTLEDCV